MCLVAGNTFLHYLLHTIDLRSEDPWENKTIYMRYVDIVVGKSATDWVCVALAILCVPLSTPLVLSLCLTPSLHSCACMWYPELRPAYTLRIVWLCTGFFKLILYVSYMVFMMWILFIPLHIARRIFVTAKLVICPGCQFWKKLGRMSLPLNWGNVYSALWVKLSLCVSRHFQKSVNDVMSSHQAIRNLNTL